jgi:hypothetical protein
MSMTNRAARLSGALLFMLAAGAVSALSQTLKHPDWEGAWVRRSEGVFDPSKKAGLAQQPPLTPEYQKIFEKSVADQAAGGQGNNPMSACIPPGMPRMMIGYGVGLEFVIQPKITYVILGEPMMQVRRIFTDGRKWTDDIEPAFTGYSIGRWESTRKSDEFDTLVVETRHIKGPRSYDSSGNPFHKNNDTVTHERIYLDPADPNWLVNDITVHDSALTRPWTVQRRYQRKRNPVWQETTCGEDEHQVKIGKEHYFVDGDGYLMPTRNGQAAPDLKHFNKAR